MTTEAIARLYKTAMVNGEGYRELVGNNGFVRVVFERMQDEHAIYAIYTGMADDTFMGRHGEWDLSNFCL